MIGSSLLMLSFGTMVYSINSATAKNINKVEDLKSNEYTEGNYVFFISNGYMYRIQKGNLNTSFQRLKGFWASWDSKYAEFVKIN